MKRLLATGAIALALFGGALSLGVASTEASYDAPVTQEQPAIAKACYYYQWVWDYRGGVRKVLLCTN